MNKCLKIYTLINICFCICIVSSCISSSKIKYIQAEKSMDKAKFKIQQTDYHVQIGDNLYIKLSSIEPVANEALSQDVGSINTQGLDAKYKDVYMVDNRGFIKLPQFNKLKVDTLTLEQIKDSVDLNIQKFYPQANCQVRLANNYVSILGDVNKPGRYIIDFSDKINIFELISMAGDLTFEANRNSVKLIRKKGGETEIIPLDLTKREIIESEYYYLLPNDVIYVEPLKAVSWHIRNIPVATTLSLLLSTTTAILVILSYIK